MFKFSKSIDTKKADPFREMRDTINAAIDTARKAGIGAGAIVDFLEKDCASLLRATAIIENDRRRATPVQYVATANGVREIDVYAEQAKSEERRAARQLKADQAEYQARLAEAAEREKWTR